jgi:ElaB/YqjD/DUF883 family membrane-anchored ribosome-binding protein
MNTSDAHAASSGFAEFDSTAQQISEEAASHIPQRHRVSHSPNSIDRVADYTKTVVHQRPMTSLFAAGMIGWALGLLAGSRQ